MQTNGNNRDVKNSINERLDGLKLCSHNLSFLSKKGPSAPAPARQAQTQSR